MVQYLNEQVDAMGGGSTGATGATGATGSQGLPGATGAAGAAGAASTVPGPAGATGAASTVAGPAGTDGAAGIAGAAGAAGAASTVPGPAGAAGAAGSSGHADDFVTSGTVLTLREDPSPFTQLTTAALTAEQIEVIDHTRSEDILAGYKLSSSFVPTVRIVGYRSVNTSALAGRMASSLGFDCYSNPLTRHAGTIAGLDDPYGAANTHGLGIFVKDPSSDEQLLSTTFMTA